MPGTRTARTTLAEDFAAARAVIPTLVDRSSALLSAVRDPGAASPLPGWTAGDVAFHLGLACTGYAAVAADDFSVVDELGVFDGFDDWTEAIPDTPAARERVTGLNALTIAKARPEDRRAAPARLRTGAETIVKVTAGRDPAEPCLVPWFGKDAHLPLATVVGLFLSETLLHTLDVARSSHQKWPIPPGTARLVISLVFPEMMPRLAHTEVAVKMAAAAVRLHVRGGVTIGVDVRGPEVRTERNPGAGRTDCHISMDPVAFLLTASGRTSQNRQIAAGRMLPYGRKPWLALQVAQLFSYP